MVQRKKVVEEQLKNVRYDFLAETGEVKEYDMSWKESINSKRIMQQVTTSGFISGRYAR